MAARGAAVIRIDAIWLVAEPLDMRASTDTVLARVAKVFGAARPHHAYLFANKSGTRVKVLVYDGYQALVRQFGMQASMSRRGNCFDNAPIESFWATPKNELIYHQRFATRDQARREFTEYIGLFYNRQRRQERLGYLSPVAFTQQFYLRHRSAA